LKELFGSDATKLMKDSIRKVDEVEIKPFQVMSSTWDAVDILGDIERQQRLKMDIAIREVALYGAVRNYECDRILRCFSLASTSVINLAHSILLLNGATPLHLIIPSLEERNCGIKDCIETVMILLQHNKNTDSTPAKSGETILLALCCCELKYSPHVIAVSVQHDVITFLLSRGADPNLGGVLEWLIVGLFSHAQIPESQFVQFRCELQPVSDDSLCLQNLWSIRFKLAKIDSCDQSLAKIYC
jgi:hypothetical protein